MQLNKARVKHVIKSDNKRQRVVVTIYDSLGTIAEVLTRAYPLSWSTVNIVNSSKQKANETCLRLDFDEVEHSFLRDGVVIDDV